MAFSGGFAAPDVTVIGPDFGRARADTGVVPGHFHMWDLAHGFGIAEGARLYLHCLLGDTPPRPIRGYGGWGMSRRTGRRALSVFDGSETPAYSIDLLIENYVVHSSDGAAGKFRILEQLCGWDRADDTPPPFVQWNANAPHHDFAHASTSQWVCESLEWGDALYTDRATLLWQKATVVLAVFRDERVTGVQAARAFPQRDLRAGWTLRDFARHYLGDTKRWKDVAELNRDNARCPTTPSFKVSKPVSLRVPPRE